MTPNEAIRLAAEKAGGVSELARRLGVPKNTLWNWINTTAGCAPAHVLAVERETGVSRSDLRPDVFPREAA